MSQGFPRSPVVDAAGRHRRLLSGRPARPDAFTSAIARSAGQGMRVSAARDALALGACEHGGTSLFPVVADRFPSFPSLAACVGMPVNRHERAR